MRRRGRLDHLRITLISDMRGNGVAMNAVWHRFEPAGRSQVYWGVGAPNRSRIAAAPAMKASFTLATMASSTSPVHSSMKNFLTSMAIEATVTVTGVDPPAHRAALEPDVLTYVEMSVIERVGS